MSKQSKIRPATLNAKPVAKLARGAENEVHSKAAVAAQRQSAKAKPVAAAKAAPAPPAAWRLCPT